MVLNLKLLLVANYKWLPHFKLGIRGPVVGGVHTGDRVAEALFVEAIVRLDFVLLLLLLLCTRSQFASVNGIRVPLMSFLPVVTELTTYRVHIG